MAPRGCVRSWRCAARDPLLCLHRSGSPASTNESQASTFKDRLTCSAACDSHNAPYRHFADKEALLSAVGTAGFEALRAHSAAAVAGATSALKALEQLGAAYIESGTLNPALYRLMFGRDLARESSPELRVAMASARVALRSILAAGARAGVFSVDADDEGALLAAVVSAWSVVHGFTLLSIDQALSREAGDTDSAVLAQQVIRRSIRGFVKA